MKTVDHLHRNRGSTNDNYYTRYEDIEKEMKCYLDFNPNLFKNKSVLCPCDNYKTSNFAKYFLDHFDELKLKRLICTSYKEGDSETGLSLLKNHEATFYRDLKGDGSFMSPEVCAYRNACDFIITNPPFSKFRQFFSWVQGKQFLIIGSILSAGYKKVFPLLRTNRIAVGPNRLLHFLASPRATETTRLAAYWYTNIPFDASLKTVASEDSWHECRDFNRYKRCKDLGFQTYDNFDAIEIPYVGAIPKDYKGVMGVPLSFFERYDPSQYKILCISNQRNTEYRIKKYQDSAMNHYAYLNVNGELKPLFTRVFIQKL